MANPARSIAMTCVSPFQPGAMRHRVLGRRVTSFPTEIVLKPKADNAESRIFLTSATSSQTPLARSRIAASSAAPNPAIPIKFSVPARRPISCPPPRICGATSKPRRSTKAPIPFGPPSLWALTKPIWQPSQLNAMGSLPKACVRSETAIPSGRSCTIPVSEFASCSADRPGSGTATPPAASTARSGAHQARTASCSTSAQTNPRPAQAKPAASVAPEVKMMSAPSAPKAAAIWPRAFSRKAFAARPSACTEDGFPTTSIAAIIAARASGRKGAVAFQSR